MENSIGTDPDMVDPDMVWYKRTSGPCLDGDPIYNSFRANHDIEVVDKPAFGATKVVDVQTKDSFKMWFMFKAEGDSIWVPLYSADWSWYGWGGLGDNGPDLLGSTPPKAGELTESSELPIWDKNSADFESTDVNPFKIDSNQTNAIQ